MNKMLEKKYEQYKNGEMDAKFEELKSKVEQKSATREEYDELKKMSRIKENITKVTNIKQLISKLEEEKNQINVVLENDKKVAEAKKQCDLLEKELSELDEKREEVKASLKGEDLSQEKRTELEGKLKELNEKIDANNSKFQKSFSILSNKKEEKISTEEAEKKAIELSSKISKCNMACSNLMKGLSWNSIEVKLDNWKERTFTKKSGMSLDSVRNSIGNRDIDINELSKKIEEQTDRIINEEENEIYEDEYDEQALVETETFAERHPRLAKIANWFKNLFTGKKEQTRQNFEDEEKNEEQENKEKKDDFKEYLKQVAEKGLDEVEKENIESAKEKLAKAKQEAIKRQNEKLGENYSRNSGDER